jgi:hypothetical protein
MAGRAAKFAVGVALLPVCAALTLTTGRAFYILAESPRRLPALPVFACVAGMAVWALVWCFMPPMTRTYVLGHELTHALWTMFFGGRASGLRVGADGGSVRVSKNNVWVTLAPYFFPLYMVAAVLLWLLLAGLLPAVRPYYPVALFWIGLAWAFHLTFTVKFLSWRQPDVLEHGRLFSYTLIYALNLLMVAAALTAVSSWTFREAAADFWGHLDGFARAVGHLAAWARERWAP